MKLQEAQKLCVAGVAVYGNEVMKDVIWPKDSPTPYMWITDGYKPMKGDHLKEKDGWNPLLKRKKNMSDVPTLILTPRFTPDAQLLWRAAQTLGWEVYRLPSWHLPADINQIRNPVLYVEALFAQTFASEMCIELHEPPEDFLPNLPMQYKKREVTLTTLAEARKRESPAFVKPPNDKSFKAAVYKAEDLPQYMDEGMSVLVSEVVQWQNEFRCYIMDRRVVTASLYIWDGKLQDENGYKCLDKYLYEAIGFAQTVANEVVLPEPLVLDVGTIKDKGWAVVEANAPWGSGIYGCKPEVVLEVIRRSHYDME
jgi:hypothetical protein